MQRFRRGSGTRRRPNLLVWLLSLLLVIQGLAPTALAKGAGDAPAPVPARAELTGPVRALRVDPAQLLLQAGQTRQLVVAGELRNGKEKDYTQKVTYTSSDESVATVRKDGLVTGVADGVATITANEHGVTATVEVTVVSLIGPPTESTGMPGLADSVRFLYEGENPVQTGVDPETIEAARVAVLRGRVITRDGQPLPGVTISVLDHPEFGQTLSRADGLFDLAVNGGGPLTVVYAKEGHLPAQRHVQAPWQDYAWLPDVAVVPLDSRVTSIDLAGTQEIQVARGNPVVDENGRRQATLLFKPGTTAEMLLPGGESLPLTSMDVRATEFTVGPGGPAAMPGELPPSTGYTYAVELSVDEALAAGATEVRFGQPVPFYVENFREFPVGEVVPVGYYDRLVGEWVPTENGRVVAIVGEAAGLAQVDTDGDGQADSASELQALGIDAAELAQLALLYEPGTSLWRVALTHFTPFDCNWPYGPPSDAESARKRPRSGRPGDGRCDETGSIIECQNQLLGEVVPVTGTPFALAYQSDRVPGGSTEAYTIQIPLTGSSVPESLSSVELRVSVAGQRFQASFGVAPDQSYTYVWNGLDGYGREIQGEVPARVEIGYSYEAQYYPSRSDYEASFGGGPGWLMNMGRANQDIILWTEWTVMVGAWDSRAAGLGGWTLSPHHIYDARGQVVYQGDGSRRHLGSLNSISTVAGNGLVGADIDGDGYPAPRAWVDEPGDVAVAPDGSLYITEPTRSVVRRVGPDGLISTVAGIRNRQGNTGDGGPAVDAQLNGPFGLAIGADGSLYIAERNAHKVRRVSPDGVISTVAGTGTGGFSGDGGPATEAQLYQPTDLAVGPDGSIYIVDSSNQRIRRIAPDGMITTFAGSGLYGQGGDGELATAAELGSISGVAVGPDGTVYLADQTFQKVRRVTPDGIISTVAGSGTGGFSGDGGPAAQAQLKFPSGLAVGADSTLYISDRLNNRIRAVGPDGVIRTVAGTGVQGYGGDRGPAGQAHLYLPEGIATAPDGSLYIADRYNHRVRRVSDLVTGASLIPSTDGGEVYLFDAGGRHLQTLDGLSGSLRYRFHYTDDGRLAAVEDSFGNMTRILRGPDNSITIVAPGGQTTRLTLDQEGYLSSIANPAGETTRLTYHPGGLLGSFQKPGGATSTFAYDNRGRLTRDTNAEGGYKELSRSATANGHTVTLTTAEGAVTVYTTEYLDGEVVRRTKTEPGGATTVAEVYPDGSTLITDARNVKVKVIQGADPRWGMLVPVLTSIEVTSPGGLKALTTRERTVTLVDPESNFSPETVTERMTINGNTYTVTYQGTDRSVTTVTPEGRTSRVMLNTWGRVVERQYDLGSGTAPILYQYDAMGRLSRLEQGDLFWEFGYDERNRIISRTDAAGRQTRYSYDEADRLILTESPEKQRYQLAYDLDGNPIRVILPSGATHRIDYMPTGQTASYTPPESGGFTTAYDLDGVRIAYNLPDGRIQRFTRDEGGRAASLTYDEAITEFDYADQTDRASAIRWTPTGSEAAQTIHLTYDADLTTSMSWTGVAQGEYAYRYNDDFLLESITFDSGSETLLTYDADGKLTGYGPFRIRREGPDGAPSQVTDENLRIDYRYYTGGDDFGAPVWPEGSQLTTSHLGILDLTLNWTPAEDDVAVSGYRIYHDGLILAVVAGDMSSYALTGLEADTEYSFKVEAGDAAGNWTTTGPALRVRTEPDRPPTWPAGSSLTATDTTPVSLTLSWPPAVDDLALTGYRVYQDGFLVATLPADITSFGVTDLAAATSYTFRVEAGDATGQWSEQGPALTLTTPPDLPPTWPAGASLAVSSLSSTSVSLSWPAASDDVAVDRYRLIVNGAVRAVVAGSVTTVELLGLTPGSDYLIAVEACDGADQCTAGGPTTAVTTPGGGGLNGELTTLRASLSADGLPADGQSAHPAVSGDGSAIAFVSWATNLVPDDTNNYCSYTGTASCADVFVLDRTLGQVERVSLYADGSERARQSGVSGIAISGDGRHVIYTVAPATYGSGVYHSESLWSYDRETGRVSEIYLGDARTPSVSEDGRYVLFTAPTMYNWLTKVIDRDTDEDGIFDEPEAMTERTLPAEIGAPRLSAGGEWVVYTQTAASGIRQVYAQSLQTDAIVAISVAEDLTEATGYNYDPEISADGRFVLFQSYAPNLTGAGSNPALVLHDRDADADGIFDEAGSVSNQRVDVASDGTPADDTAEAWRISENGRYALFTSPAANLVEGDNNYNTDLFRHDRTTGETLRLSLSATGEEADADIRTEIDLNDDGLTAVYTSLASNLVAADENNLIDIFFTAWLPSEPPTWPAGSSLTTSAVTHEGLTLNWSPAADNQAVGRYAIYQDHLLLTTLPGDAQSHQVTGLLPDTSYSFQVEAGDLSGNWSATGPSVTVTTLADTVPPQVSTAEVEGDQLLLRFSERLDPASVPATSDFVVRVNGAAQAAPLAVALLDESLSLTLATAVAKGDLVTLSYTPGEVPLQDLYGNQVPPLTDLAVTNLADQDRMPPQLQSGNRFGTMVFLTYSEPLDPTSIPSPEDFELVADTPDGFQEIPIAFVSISDSRVMISLYDAVPDYISCYLTYMPGASPIRDLTMNEASFFAMEPLTYGFPGLAATPTTSLAAPPVGADSGLLATRTHTVADREIYRMALGYDAMGRIISRVESVAGTAHTYGYTYDDDGQLLEVTRDGLLVERYRYDANGNRVSSQVEGGTERTATYDAQDRLTSLDGTGYSFSAAGYLTGRGADSFRYSARGELLAATLAGGQTITYTYDGLGRQVSRTDADGTYQYLYGNPLNPFQVSEIRHPDGAVSTLFYDDAGIIYALRRNGSLFYVAADQVGTPKVVADAAGSVVKVLSYDSFGNLISDSNPSFDLPIGFAGGLRDASTGLLRFGFRDYDPAAGRWTARDPILFQGKQANLYVYVANNPISLQDPTGLFCVGGSVYVKVGGGAKVCIDDDWDVSVCGEIGFGIGMGYEVDPFGGTDDTGTKIKAEAKCQAGPMAGGGGISFSECGFAGEAKECAGPLCLKANSKGELGAQVENFEWGFGCEAKLAGEACKKF